MKIMKKLSLILCAAMLMTLLAAIVPASAAAPTGQIWESNELRQGAVTASGVLPYYQNNAGYNDEATFPTSARPSMDGSMFTKLADGDTLTITLDVKCEGDMQFYTQLLSSYDFGIFDIYWDDLKIVENLDLYSPKESRGFKEYDLGKRYVAAGTHTLKIQVVGKNALSANFYFLIDFFELVGSDGVRRTQRIGERDENYGIKSVLEDGTIRLEGEALTISEQTLALYSETAYDQQYYGKEGAYLSNNCHRFWKKPIAPDIFTLEFEVETPGEYEIAIGSMGGKDYGICYWLIDGQIYGGECNQYSATFSTIRSELGKVMLDSGKHTVGMMAMGQDPLSVGFVLSLDYIDLKLVGDYDSGSTPTVTTTEKSDDTTEKPSDVTTTEPSDVTTTESKQNSTTEKPNDTVTKSPDVTTAQTGNEKSCGGMTLTAFASVVAIFGAGFTVLRKKH